MTNHTNTTDCAFDAGMRFECASFFPIFLYIIIFYCVIRIAYDCATGGCEPGPIDMTPKQKRNRSYNPLIWTPKAPTWTSDWQRRNKERSSSLPDPETGLRM